jgi:hypothetical protein
MSSTLTPHPGHETLLRMLDGDLPGSERQAVDGHLESCRACQRELEEVRESLNGYLRFHDTVLKPALPSAPKPWDRLDLHAAGIPARRARVFPLTPRRWLAVAAAIGAVFVLSRLTQRTPEVKAAELLRKAASAEKTAPIHARTIRIKSRKYKWDRPARLPEGSETTAGDASEIRHLLESAGYNWEEPLSAEAYLGWHDRLTGKQDRVESGAQTYVIHTATPVSPVTDASLTLRAADLRAIACTLQFGAADTLEMTEIPDEERTTAAGAPHATPPAAQPAPATVSVRPAGPGEELQVVAALHRIGADLGEPIEVRREGAGVLVSVTGLDVRRQNEVKAALSGLAPVRLQFSEFERRENQAAARRPAPQVDVANPLLAELQAALPAGVSTADLADQLTEGTDRIIERVYALRVLARRFPVETAAQMTASEIATLHGIVRDHSSAIAPPVSAIERLLQPILPQANPAHSAESTWQDAAQAMLADARGLDQALHTAGGSGDAGARKTRAARALADLQQRLARIRTLIPQ